MPHFGTSLHCYHGDTETRRKANNFFSSCGKPDLLTMPGVWLSRNLKPETRNAFLAFLRVSVVKMDFSRCREFPIITFFAMLAEIESLNFVVCGDTQPDQHIDNLQNNQRAHNRNSPRDHHCDELISKLTPVAIHDSGR